MRFLSVFISCLLIVKVFADPAILEEKKQTLQVIKNSPFLSYSAEFIFQDEKDCLAKIIRTGFMCPRYFYDLYDNNGSFNARGITRAFSLGLLFARVTDIDVFDNQENFIGLIEGKVLKRSRAKFNFYDLREKLIAIAYINSETTDIVIVNSDNPAKIYAKFVGQSFGEVGSLNIDFIAKDNPIDNRILKVFAAFISDFYETFLPSSEQNFENMDVMKSSIDLGVVLLDAYLRLKDN